MSEVHWLNAVSGSFTNAADWSGGAVPGPSDDAILDAPGSTPYTVTVTSVQMIISLQTAANATLDLASGYVGDAEGTGAGVNAGIILVGAGATFVAGGEIVSSGRIEVYGAGATFSATGEVANSGTISIDGTASGGAFFLVKNTATFFRRRRQSSSVTAATNLEPPRPPSITSTIRSPGKAPSRVRSPMAPLASSSVRPPAAS